MSQNSSVDYDAIVVGAGFSGLRALHELRNQQGLTVRVLEAGTDVGGTWYWNRYPGARTDSEAWVYCYSFDESLTQEWNWTERFPQREEVQRYLSWVSDKLDLRKDIQFSTRMDAAHYDEAANVWKVTTDGGETLTCTYVVCASGLLSVTNDPPFPGVETFEGEWYQTSRWPKEEVDFRGKRVGVIGAGATAVQAIPIIALNAEHMSVFQRTPNYVMPSRNRLLEEPERQAIKANYDKIWETARQQVFAFPFEPANRVAADMKTEEEHQQVLEAGWEAGGFRYLFETFDDLLIDQHSNDVASEFVRRKIRAIVKDPETADLLCPTNHPFGGKRPPLGHWYYETYNRDNVSLVSIKDNPIAEITPKGVKLADGTEHEFDMLVFAMGFDAVTGAMSAMDIRGRDGRSINDEWKNGPDNNFLGVACEGFPNLFMMLGPGGPFANLPVIIDAQGEWIGRAVAHAREQGADVMEPKPESAERWVNHCEELFNATLLKEGAPAGNAWYVGANIEGRAPRVLFYFGGAGAYQGELAEEANGGFTGFTLSKSKAPA